MVEKFSYEAIEPLVTQVEQEGEIVYFTFRCPATGLEIEAPIVPGQDGLAELNEPKSTGFFGVLESIFGEGRDDWEEEEYSRPEIEEAAVIAFEQVSSDFVWDGTRWVFWEANDSVVGFFEQLENGPVESKHDRNLLKRILLEVLNSDGVVAEAELELFADLVGEPPQETAGLLKQAPLQDFELREVTNPAVRETLLMLGFAMACCDDELAREEEVVLERIQEALEIGDLRAWELKKFAQCYSLDERFSRIYAEGEVDPVARGEVATAAEKIGVSLDETQKIELRYRKRSGLETVHD